MAKGIKRAALYVRVSTDHQSVENQIRELRQVAERRGWNVVGRDQRPGLGTLLKDASRRKFDVVMAWAIARQSGRERALPRQECSRIMTVASPESLPRREPGGGLDEACQHGDAGRATGSGERAIQGKWKGR